MSSCGTVEIREKETFLSQVQKQEHSKFIWGRCKILATTHYQCEWHLTLMAWRYFDREVKRQFEKEKKQNVKEKKIVHVEVGVVVVVVVVVVAITITITLIVVIIVSRKQLLFNNNIPHHQPNSDHLLNSAFTRLM